MAYQHAVFQPAGLKAAADLSAKQFYFVKKNAVNGEVALASVDGEIVMGVLQNDPTAGQGAEVMALGLTKVVADEALTAGDYVGTSVDGQAKIVETTNTGADIGDYVVGQVFEGAGAGAIATIMIGIPSFIVESA